MQYLISTSFSFTFLQAEAYFLRGNQNIFNKGTTGSSYGYNNGVLGR